MACHPYAETVLKYTPDLRANTSRALALLAKLTAPGYRPACMLTPARMARYAPLCDTPSPVLLALILFDFAVFDVKNYECTIFIS